MKNKTLLLFMFMAIFNCISCRTADAESKKSAHLKSISERKRIADYITRKYAENRDLADSLHSIRFNDNFTVVEVRPGNCKFDIDLSKSYFSMDYNGEQWLIMANSNSGEVPFTETCTDDSGKHFPYTTSYHNIAGSRDKEMIIKLQKAFDDLQTQVIGKKLKKQVERLRKEAAERRKREERYIADEIHRQQKRQNWITRWVTDWRSNGTRDYSS